ncbi:hypothetical protein [Candidatus Methanocrinis natronophilus]|uniref:Uncharacterized protein n=1 Tax=Candidatus Methanocrinis natronophilus TaxID=3033396 RepID=A0ABT5X6F2_9EURY|nr:hypothetical protein [Candidatus Methanocrinis natronophilus]MDF0590264.1 hypothetical protein [Candidatus Methanocrinis natronophilus]
MFEPDEESVVLEIICGLMDISPEEMMNIGEMAKKILVFDPDTQTEEEAVGRLKSAVTEMSKEEALVAGVFISGLLRCNLRDQFMQAAGGYDPYEVEEADEGCGCGTGCGCGMGGPAERGSR